MTVGDELKEAELLIKVMGAKLYATFGGMERGLVRFGMFPAAKMEAAHAELLAMKQHLEIFDGWESRDLTNRLAVAVFDAANAGPEKVVV